MLLHEEKILLCIDKVSIMWLIINAWSLYNKASFHLTNPFPKASGNNHENTSMTLIVYFRLESCLHTDKLTTNQNIVITVFLSFLSIALFICHLVNLNVCNRNSNLYYYEFGRIIADNVLYACKLFILLYFIHKL